MRGKQAVAAGHEPVSARIPHWDHEPEHEIHSARALDSAEAEQIPRSERQVH
jgi:hypothetical protein